MLDQELRDSVGGVCVKRNDWIEMSALGAAQIESEVLIASIQSESKDLMLHSGDWMFFPVARSTMSF